MIRIIDNTENLIIFAYSIVAGLLAGIIYDGIRAFRYTKKPGKKLKYIEDLLFWFIITILFFIFSVRISDGILRGFLYIGFFAGGSLYFLLGSKYLFPIFHRIFQLIIYLINEIIKILKTPFVKFKLKRRLKRLLLMRKEMKAERKKHWKSIRGKK